MPHNNPLLLAATGAPQQRQQQQQHQNVDNVRSWLSKQAPAIQNSGAKMMEAEHRRIPPPPPPRGITLLQRSSSVNVVTPATTSGSAVCAPAHRAASACAAPSSASSSSRHHHGHYRNVGGPDAAGVTYLETRFAYSVNGILGSAAQASAAAAFFARASQKLNLASPQRRKRHGSTDDDGASATSSATGVSHHFRTDFCGLLRRNPPAPPVQLIRRLGTRENPGVGKVRVMLRVAPSTAGDSSSFLSVDKRRKQITLQEPSSGYVNGCPNGLSISLSSLESGCNAAASQDRRVGVAAPKMFAFDGLFTPDDTQGDVASSVLSDIVTAVINGSDGCVFCFGHAKLGKTYTMVGNWDAPTGSGLIPTAIAWLFRGIAEQKTKTGARFSVRVSAVEVAGPNETLRDLLAPHATESEQSPGVYLRDDPLLGTQLQNQSELRAPTLEKAAFYLDAALAARSETDPRFSHLLYTLHVYQYSVDRTGRGGVAGGRSRLHLLDLGSCDRIRTAPSAGSSSSPSHSGSAPMTLSALGNVLVALFNGQRHLPHREHKITQVLRECLGSLTCQAALVAHVAATSSYSETLSTVQMASRVHRMRRRRIKQYAGSGGSGSGSSEESRLGLTCSRSSGEDNSSASADPSSSEQSCDTVIYVGPIDDATDGEHPPVYLPSLNSGDNRCSMSKVLRGSTAEQQQTEQRNKIHHSSPSKSSQGAHAAARKAEEAKVGPMKTAVSKVQNPANKPVPMNRSPQAQRKSSKAESTLPAEAAKSGKSEEQWIDGPRIHKSRMSDVRHMVRHQRETWIDGPPMGTASASATAAGSAAAALGYGFMDEHKQGMIRQWVETQSAQVQRQIRNGEVWIDSPKTTAAVPVADPAAPMKTLTVFKTCEDDEDSAEDRPVVVPPVPAVKSAASAPKTQSALAKVAEEKRRPPKIEAPLEPAAPAPVKAAEAVPTVAHVRANAILDQLYSQCEQLAESFTQESEDLSNASEGEAVCDHLLDQSASELASISCDSWRRMTHDTIQEEEDEEEDRLTATDDKEAEDEDAEDQQTEGNSSCTASEQIRSRSGDYSPEYIEVEEPDEPVPTQDSCLQVTEEDIALSMMEAAKCAAVETTSHCGSCADSCEHPLRVLSQENLTIISHFTGETFSQGTASDWEPIDSPYGSSIFDQLGADGVAVGTQSDFFKTQLEHLARLHHQMYHPAGTTGALHPTPLSALSASQIGSFKDLPLLSQNWSHGPTAALQQPPAASVSGSAAASAAARTKSEETRKTMVSTIGVELERELGLQDAQQLGNNALSSLSSLRHPDGASNPHLDKHSSTGRVHETGYPPISDTDKRLPGNGASTSDPEDESKKVNNHPSYTTPLDVTAEPPVVPPVMERTVPMGKSDGESDDKTPVSHKTPKLSRFFGKNKRSKSPAVSSKRTAATSMSNGSPTLGKSVTAINSSPAKHSSPKTDKRSSSKCRDPLTGKSPSKSTSKSPARNECAVPASPKSRSSVSKSSNGKNSSSSALLSHRSPKKDASKLNWPESKSSKRVDVKSYGFSYEGCNHHHHHHNVGHQTATGPGSLCPSEGYESGGSDSGVHISTTSPPVKSRRHGAAPSHHSLHGSACESARRHLMPIGELSRKNNFSSGTSTSGSGGSGGSAGHYESSGYESVIRDSECSSLGSSQDSDREAPLGSSSKPAVAMGQSSSCNIL